MRIAEITAPPDPLMTQAENYEDKAKQLRKQAAQRRAGENVRKAQQGVTTALQRQTQLRQPKPAKPSS